MKKPYLLLAALAASLAVMFAPAAFARQQAPVQFEYGTLSTFASQGTERGYRFCVAASTDWSCRDFTGTDGTVTEMRTALATTLNALGSQGWELASVKFYESNDTFDEYIFKRERRERHR